VLQGDEYRILDSFNVSCFPVNMLTHSDAYKLEHIDVTAYMPGDSLPDGNPFLYFYITPEQVSKYIQHHVSIGRSPQTAVKLLGIDQDTLREYCRQNPQVANTLRQSFGIRLLMLEDLAMNNARNGDSKILQVLMTHAGFDKPEDANSRKIYTEEQREAKIARLLEKSGKLLR
jgi:hypothetical protein